MARTNAVHDRNILGFSLFFAEPLRSASTFRTTTLFDCMSERYFSFQVVASRQAAGNPDFSS